MNKILLLGREFKKLNELSLTLGNEGFSCVIPDPGNDKLENLLEHGVDLVLVDLNGSTGGVWMASNREQLRDIKVERKLPVVVLLSKNMVQGIDMQTPIDDFVVEPYDFPELVVRIKRILNNKALHADGEEIIACGDLIIDTSKCEVYLDNRLLSLTFTEYELLRFLAKNKGRVFTRDALLNEVWGYDYYGGDRTVDVHVRRLRNKIEDPDHVFIETVRNVGYKFKETIASGA